MKAVVEKTRENRGMHISSTCAHCHENTKSRRRDFSEQTWSVLLVWGEIQKPTVDQPICDHCYNELREILIDRSQEIEVAVNPGDDAGKPAAAAKGAAKSRKATKLAS